MLCSLTTQLGYFALLLSINRAVQSFGLAAAVGEITTLVAAVLVLPAFLFWGLRRRGVAVRGTITNETDDNDDDNARAVGGRPNRNHE